MPLEVPELECRGTARCGRKQLRAFCRDGRPTSLRLQSGIGGFHAGNNDGEMLKQWTPRGNCGRVGFAFRVDAEQLNLLAAQYQYDGTSLRAGNAEERCKGGARQLRFIAARKSKSAFVE